MQRKNKQMLESDKKTWLWLLLFALIAWTGALVWFVFFYSGGGFDKSNPMPPMGETILAENKQVAVGSIVPTDTKTPEEFMNKVQEKAEEIQKNYDSSLTEFAARKWKKFFEEYNGVSDDYLSSHIKIVKQEVRKTEDQSTLFKINYRIEKGESQEEAEDFFFLILSEQKRGELGLTSLKSSTFLSEEDIKKNIAKEGFAKITKIQK